MQSNVEGFDGKTRASLRVGDTNKEIKTFYEKVNMDTDDPHLRMMHNLGWCSVSYRGMEGKASPIAIDPNTLKSFEHIYQDVINFRDLQILREMSENFIKGFNDTDRLADHPELWSEYEDLMNEIEKGTEF